MTTRRIGLIGCGDVSVVHLEAIRDIEGLELVGVADTDPQALTRATEATGVPGFASTQELIDALHPDAVHVTTPHDQHVGPALTALAAGVHVLQEKPLAHTLEEGRRLVEALAAAPAGGPKVGICFQNRYNLASRHLHEMLASGELGAVRGAWASVVWTRSADYYRAKPWRGTWENSGGGLLINQAIHTLDLVQWLLGGVERTDGHVATRKYADLIEVEDTAELLLHHPGGVTTSFYATLTAPQHRPVELEIDCENAYVTVGGGTSGGLTIAWKDGRVDHVDERAVTSGGRSYWGVSHELLIRDFYEHLEDPEPFWIGPGEAIKSLEILKEAYRLSGVGPQG
ncbi:dehydrogenase [Brachybacterium ginsengisoli]|uniref:Dehydrogenase n=1 Tax=Brachybacterium ginsengisoli TaxID=1331682 RepID=A0A291H127_9MICO|nr:Gfo/Idh/MocA family oxidoreductase [Brachybacterium ginsengisoli]ATG56155.1 dehydrogenase [Brachybacterium ginsengisoli]